jgi:hypothetical protein
MRKQTGYTTRKIIYKPQRSRAMTSYIAANQNNAQRNGYKDDRDICDHFNRSYVLFMLRGRVRDYLLSSLRCRMTRDSKQCEMRGNISELRISVNQTIRSTKKPGTVNTAHLTMI